MSRMKVFIVEDEVVIREAIHRMIPWDEYGFAFCGEASDGEMALPLIRSEKPDLILTDIKMPFMDGLTFAKLVKKEMPETKIVIISGYDDFTYAQQAITLGIECYLLKPVSKGKLLEVLGGIREKYEKDNAQKSYYETFQREIREYEKNSRRDFFEALVGGGPNGRNRYEWAEQLGIDILAGAYNIVLFTMEDNNAGSEGYSDEKAKILERIEGYFAEHTAYLLFRNQMFSYAVIVKGEPDSIEAKTAECVNALGGMLQQKGTKDDYFICTGKPVERLSMLKESYQAAGHAFALRYIENKNIVYYGAKMDVKGEEACELDISSIDTNVMDAEVLYNFLWNALPGEVEEFAGNYMRMVGQEALRSQMFRQYVVLYVHFCTMNFIQKLGIDKDKLKESGMQPDVGKSASSEEVRESIIASLTFGITLRDESAKSRYKSVIQTALRFIQEHYTDDSLSLNQVARAANVSTNHFSALFGQEMGETFIEYLTGLRMKRAKELLRSTDMRSGEIALEVGYKDPHYFSFLFKKTCGCTASEYRKGISGAGERTAERNDADEPN